MSELELDTTPRYLPDRILCGGLSNGYGMYPVIGTTFYPAGADRPGCPIRLDWGCLEVKTEIGSRFFGVRRAYINSELRMIVVGIPARDEVRQHWEVVPDDRR